MSQENRKRLRGRASAAARLFLAALSHGASVRGAAAAANRSRQTFYRWRTDHPDFADQWDAAIEDGTDRLEDEAVLRATAGASKPVFYGGKLIGHERRHSDTLLMFLLKARRPEKFDPTHAPAAPSAKVAEDSDVFLKRISQLLSGQKKPSDS